MQADGCRGVFIDAGANQGFHTRYLLAPQNFSRSQYHATHFAKYFGPQAATDSAVCAFLFEPNVFHAPTLHSLASAHNATRTLRVFMSAISGRNADHVVMYNHKNDGGSKNHWAFGARRPSWRPINVSAIDIGGFVRDELIHRRIPPPSYDGAPPPAIVMKMDVEGTCTYTHTHIHTHRAKWLGTLRAFAWRLFHCARLMTLLELTHGVCSPKRLHNATHARQATSSTCSHA